LSVDAPSSDDLTQNASGDTDDIERDDNACADHKAFLEILVDSHGSPLQTTLLQVERWRERGEEDKEEREERGDCDRDTKRAHFAVLVVPIAVPSERENAVPAAPITAGVCRFGRINVVTIATPMIPISTFSTVVITGRLSASTC
jgi:hypothetical protein